MKCATCGAELIEVGFPDEGFQEYRCPNGCENIFSTRVKLFSAILLVIGVLLLIGAAILVLPLWVTSIIKSKLSKIIF